MKIFFLKENKSGKIRLRFGRVLIALLVLALLVKTIVEVFTNQAGRDYRSESDVAYLKTVEVEDNPPNVIIILADDLGFGDLSATGSQAISTPHLDNMVNEGALLTNFQSASPISSPSRAGLLTGRYPVRTLVSTVFIGSDTAVKPVESVMKLINTYSYDVDGIPEDEILLSEILQYAEYETALVGKWHLGVDEDDHPNNHGFDLFYGAMYSNDMNPYRIYKNDEVVQDVPVDQTTLTKDLTKVATTFIKDNSDRPFFLYYASPFPHYPAHASEDFIGTSEAGTYGDCVQELDWSVGEIMDTLVEAGVEDNTLVIFTSDNGPWFEGSVGDYRGRKGDVYSGGQHVPMIAWMPSIITDGFESNALSSGIDILPTVLDILGVDLPTDRIIDGVSMLPVLTQEADSYRDILFLQKDKSTVGVMNDTFKYLDKISSDMGLYWMLKQGPHLFDFSVDQRESYDVSMLYPEVKEELVTELEVFRASLESNLRGWID